MFGVIKRRSILTGLLIVCWSACASGSRYLKIRWEGEVKVPLNKSDFGSEEAGAKWWGEVVDGEVMILMQSRLRHVVEFHFSEISERSQIKVYDTRRLAKKGWKLRRQLVDITEGSFATRGKRGVRIIANKDATFTLRYFRGFCPVPVIVTANSCTKKKEKESVCNFSCRPPQYFPVNESNFSSKCQTNRSWSEDVSEACISKKEIEMKCLSISAAKGTCPLSSEKLLAIYSEQKRENDLPRASLNFLGLTLRGRYAQYTWQLPQLDPRPDGTKRTAGNDCFEFCIIDGQTKAYKASCGSQPTSPTDLMMTCLMCRYVYKTCSQHDVVA